MGQIKFQKFDKVDFFLENWFVSLLAWLVCLAAGWFDWFISVGLIGLSLCWFDWFVFISCLVYHCVGLTGLSLCWFDLFIFLLVCVISSDTLALSPLVSIIASIWICLHQLFCVLFRSWQLLAMAKRGPTFRKWSPLQVRWNRLPSRSAHIGTQILLCSVSHPRQRVAW